jgi:hypothetical protein
MNSWAYKNKEQLNYYTYGQAVNNLDIGNDAGTQLEKKTKITASIKHRLLYMNMSTSQDVI